MVAVVGFVVGVPWILYGFWLVTHADRKIQNRGLLSLLFGYGVLLVMCVLVRDMIGASCSAAVMAFCLYVWWNNGGGDGMKRRLRSWARYFGMAAPQTA